MLITTHAEKQFKKRFFEMWVKAHNPTGLLKNLIQSGTETRFRNQKAIVNGSLVAPYVINESGRKVIKTIIREI